MKHPDTIYMTGLPRSGTTWAGNVLAAGTGTPIINEPFNSQWNAQRKPFEMLYLPAGKDRLKSAGLLSTSEKFTRILRHELFPLSRPRRLWRILKSSQVMIRDVHTILALAHIWELYQPATIVIIRHPCAVADSWQRVGFSPLQRIAHLLSQHALIADHLSPFINHLSNQADEFACIGAYWGAIHLVLFHQQQQYPAWRVVTHESLCNQPEEMFSDLARSLNLEFAQPGYAYLDAHNNPPTGNESLFSLNRLSVDEPGKWRQTLSSQQIQSVIRAVEPFSVLNHFYPEIYK